LELLLLVVVRANRRDAEERLLRTTNDEEVDNPPTLELVIVNALQAQVSAVPAITVNHAFLYIFIVELIPGFL
jgi:hypothetical protein